MPKRLLRCAGCGRQFETTHKTSEYCTKRCYNKFYMPKFEAAHPELTRKKSAARLINTLDYKNAL